MTGKRLSKRQLREQQDLQALAGPQRKESDSETLAERTEGDLSSEVKEEGELGGESRGGEGLFAQLGQVDESVESSDSEADIDVDDKEEGGDQPQKPNKKKKKPKKKKKLAQLEGEDVNSSNTNGTNTPQKVTSTIAKASNTKNTKGAKDVSTMSMDEFSALLDSQAALNMKNKTGDDLQANAPRLSGPLPSLRAHLALSAPFLDPTVELKRQFGAAAIKAYESEANSANQSRGGGAANAVRARAMAWNTNFKVKSILVQPQDTWPPIAKTFTGMTMETIEDDHKGKVGGWIHSK